MDFEQIPSLVITASDLRATNFVSVLESEDKNIKPDFLEY